MPEPVSCPASTADDRATSDRKEGVQFRLQLVVVNASGHERVQEVARIERDEVAMETLGLTLAEGKLILKSIQRAWSRGRSRRLSFGGAIARNAARHVTARGITTTRFARCLGISSCRARGWSTAGARCMWKRPTAPRWHIASKTPSTFRHSVSRSREWRSRRTRPLAGPRLALMAWGGSTRACGEQTPLQETTSQMKRRAGYCETCAPGGWSRSTGTKWRSGSDCVDRHKRCRETKHLATQASSFRCGEDGSRGVV